MVERQGRHADRPSQRARAGPQTRPTGQAPGLSTDPLADAFTGRYDAALAGARSLPSEQRGWLRAYVAAALGKFPAAERTCRTLLEAADPAVRLRAHLTLGSVLRQTDRHAEARETDRRARRIARNAADAAHTEVGLAADHVGLGDANGCARHLRAASGLAPRPDWRAWVRLRWVRAERALLVGEPARAVRESRTALARARAAGARRHEAKSLLFLGASLQAAGIPAAQELRAAERIARRIGARPIADVAVRLLREGPG